MSTPLEVRNNNIAKDYSSGMDIVELVIKYQISGTRIYKILSKLGTSKKTSKTYSKVVLNDSEKNVFRKITNMGYDIIPQPYTAPFDFLVNGKKVEVKYRRSDMQEYMQFNGLKGYPEVDIYIFMIGSLEDPLYLVIPTQDLKSHDYRLPTSPKNKNTVRFYRKYKDNWTILK